MGTEERLEITDMDIRLDWEGPLSFKEVISEERTRTLYNCPGLYLWKRPDEPASKIIYIGKSEGSLYQRLLNHYMVFISGGYTIPAEFRESGVTWKFEIKSSEVTEEIFNEADVQKLAGAGFRFASHLQLFCARTNGKEGLSEAERLLVYHLQPERNRHGKSSLNVKRNLIVRNKGTVEVINNSLVREQRLESIYSSISF